MFDIKEEPIDILIDNLKNDTKRRIEQEKKYHGNYVNTIKHMTNLKSYIPSIIIPVIKRAFPKLLAHNVVGVQPIARPDNYVSKIQVFNGSEDETFELAPRNNRLALRWEFECIENTKRNQGYDPTEEVLNYLAKELVQELDYDLYCHLLCAAEYHKSTDVVGPAKTYKGTLTFDDTKKNEFTGNYEMPLSILINRQANLIALRNKRVAGNWCIVNKRAYKALLEEHQHNNNFQPVLVDSVQDMQLVGYINSGIKVYLSNNTGENTPVVVGYKGSETDASAIYAPYNLLTTNGVTIDPQTFEPIITFLSYSGMYSLKAKDYLGLVEFEQPIDQFI